MKVTGITEFKRRRQRLMAMMEPGSVALIPSANQVVRNRYVTHPFRQDSDFYYLCGLDQPGACLVLIPDRVSGESILFCKETNEHSRIWHGEQIGPDDASALLGTDDAFPIEDIDDIIPGLIEECSRIYCNLGHETDFDQKLMDWLSQLNTKRTASVADELINQQNIADLSFLLHEQRLIKSTKEQGNIKKAGVISSRAHNRAMKMVRPGLFEYQLDAEIQHEFAMSGARRAAYSSIVASGVNSCTLHYMDNTRKMKAGELVLVDAGCEYNYYAADITRTYPVSGIFSVEQRAIYDLVLKSQKAAIAQVKPGNSFNMSHDAAYQVIIDGLIKLGITSKSKSDIKSWFMHRTAHWLGMDVHDVGEYRIGDQWRMLEPGMVMAIEPGLYFQKDETRIDPKWRGIGIRIEDMVLVTKDGNQVLSSDALKEPGDIEQWMNNGQKSLF